MEKEKDILPLLILFLAGITRADLLYDLIRREDPCIALCENTPLDFKNNDYLKSCCQRGCRFFNLVDGLAPINLNGSRTVCDDSCIEAYVEDDRQACSKGCELMAKQRDSDYFSLTDFATKSIPISIHVEGGIDSSVILMSSDVLENDMTDPGLRKELLPRWWDTNGFKLPETYVKTVPKDTWIMDYDIPLEFSSETKQSISIPGSDWLQCASKHTGIPQWLLGSAIITAALSGLWLCLSRDKTIDIPVELIAEKPSTPSKEPLYMQTNVLWYKTPPPKYTEVVDLDVNIKA